MSEHIDLGALRAVVEKKVGGMPWEEIATVLQLPLAEIRAWPLVHPVVWKKAYRLALRELFDDALTEAVFSLRGTLRDGDKRLKVQASNALVRLWQTRHPAPRKTKSCAEPVQEERQKTIAERAEVMKEIPPETLEHVVQKNKTALDNEQGKKRSGVVAATVVALGMLSVGSGWAANAKSGATASFGPAAAERSFFRHTFCGQEFIATTLANRVAARSTGGMDETDFFDARPETVAARLDLTVDVMRELSRATDPQAMYRVYARRMADIFPTTRQISLSRRGLQAPQFRITRFNLWNEEVNPWIDAHKLPLAEGGLFADLLYAGRPTVVPDLHIPDHDPAAMYLEGQRSLLAIPLFDEGEAVNMVVVTRETPNAFPPQRLPELVWMSNLFGRATQTALLSQKLHAAHAEAEHELKRIAKIQKALLPIELPRISTLDLGAYCRSTNAGGDYYDVFRLPRSRVGLLLVDVCGHGASAATLVAVVHSLAKTYSGPTTPPGLLLTYINEHLARMSTRSFGMFVTAVYAIYDPDRATLMWANAGHPPPRLIRANGTREVLEGARSVPLGIVDDTPYPESEIGLMPGDALLLYTDGVTDAKNPAGEAFGTERLDDALAAGASGARTMMRSVLDRLEAFTAGAPPTDDYTLLAMRFIRSKKKAGEISGEWPALRG